jgi:hypothetical protein
MMDTLAQSRPAFKEELAAWTCVYLSSGTGKVLRGRLIDCTRDIEEVTSYVSASQRPKITNACQ